MNIKKISNNEVVVHGTIKYVGEYQDLKNIISELIDDKETNKITIHMRDSVSVTSSLIGYFLKLVYQDGIELNLTVTDVKLYDLLNDLKLVEVFNIKHINSN